MSNEITVKNWRRNRGIAEIVAATFPQYRKTKVILRSAEFVELHGLNWFDGSRCEFATYSNGKGQQIGDHMSWPGNNRDEGRKVDIVPGGAIVEGGVFCGKEATLFINLMPDHPLWRTVQ